MLDKFRIECGHAIDILRNMPDNYVQSCITSPPYFGQRNYGTDKVVWPTDTSCDNHRWAVDKRAVTGVTMRGYSESRLWNKAITGPPQPNFICDKCGSWLGELGTEGDPALYIQHLLMITGQIKRVLKRNGTLWLNLGDTFIGKTFIDSGVKIERKNLAGIPFRVALSLQDQGWIWTSVIPWIKENIMPDAATNRPVLSQEYFFLFANSTDALYQQNEVSVDTKNGPSVIRYIDKNGNIAEKIIPKRKRRTSDWWVDSVNSLIEEYYDRAIYLSEILQHGGILKNNEDIIAYFNIYGSNSWQYCINCDTYYDSISGLRENDKLICRKCGRSDAWIKHFATFPPRIIEPMIRASTRPNDIVLDPFSGTASTGVAALNTGRRYIGIEVSHEYYKASVARLKNVNPLGIGCVW